MATSIIKFYKNDLLRVDKNFMYSERKESSYFETFLNKSLKKTIDNFQYIKHGLDISIKVKESQTNLYNKATTNLPYNYVSIKNSDSDRIYYYYIVSGTWRSSNCIQYELSIDTIATFWDTIQTSMTDKSTVVREHRDRFYKINGDLHEGSLLIRKIDPVSEGIQVANKVEKNDRIVEAADLPSNVSKWYIVYRTEVNKDNLSDIPIKCYLCCDKDVNLEADGVNYLDTKNLNKDYIYYFYNESANSNGGVSFTNQGGTDKQYNLNSTLAGVTGATLRVISINYSADKWVVNAYYFTGDKNIYETTTSEFVSSGNTIIELVDGMTRGYVLEDSSKLVSLHDYYLYLYLSENAPVIYVNGGTVVWKSIKSVDRTMSNLNTIIELPYCPSNEITYDTVNHVYNYDSNIWEWSNEFNQLKLIDLNSEFYRSLNVAYNIPDMAYYIKDIEISSFYGRIDKTESKIYHSDFSQLKYVYDSFSMTLDRERLNITSDLTTPPSMNLNYKQSNNITSNLLFDITFDGQDTSYKKLNDNDPILLATRNNEVTIYQDNYINYMRNGYNYDKKAQAIQNVQQIVGVASSAIQSALSVGANFSSIISNNALLKKEFYNQLNQNSREWDLISNSLRMGLKENKMTQQEYKDQFSTSLHLTLNKNADAREAYDAKRIQQKKSFGTSTQLMIQNSVGIIGSISSAITSKMLQENSMNQKLAELQAQSASTAGSNDLNLLNYYNKNKLHEMKYELTDNMKESVYDLFYYMGYATNIQKKPDLYSRSLFNFIMINPEFDNTLDATVNKEYIEDIKARLASGLTIWHDTTRHTYGYNNTERWILDQYVEE